MFLLDDRIILDRTTTAEGPGEEDKKIARDVLRFIGKDKTKRKKPNEIGAYLITEGGAGRRVFERGLSHVEYQFAPVVSKETLDAWTAMLLAEGYKSLIGDDVFISPDPNAETKFVLRFSLNPVFEAKVADATTLEPTLEVTTTHPVSRSATRRSD
jgi:hypothetical protein